MDYDDDYDRYQQEEDELYKDPSEDSNEDEVDSELEDTLLGHIHYSSNVYKKIGSNTKTSAPESTNVSSAVSTPKNGHLALSGADDYFKAVNQGTELDDHMDQGIASSSSNPVTASQSITKRKRGDDEEEGMDDEDEESRYSVEKKDGSSKKASSWNDQVAAPRTAGPEDSDSDMSISSVSEERDSGVGDEEDEVTSVGDSEMENSDQALDEHVLDLGTSTENVDGTDNNYDLDTELGHLDNEDFKGRNRYYMEKEAGRKCHKCGEVGHIGRECTVTVCYICGAKDDHVARDCPNSICYNCNKKGHISEKCPMPRGYGQYTDCRKCGSRAHATEDCPTVWRSYIMKSNAPLQPVVAYCYNCAALGHFGDDCNMLRPTYARAGSAFNIAAVGGQSGNTRDAPGISLSSSRHRPTSSSIRDRYSTDRDRDRDRDHYRDRDRDHYRDRDGRRDHRDRDRRGHDTRERERDRHRDRDRDRNSSRNSRSDRESRYKDRDAEGSSRDYSRREDRKYEDDLLTSRDSQSSKRAENRSSKSSNQRAEGSGSRDSPVRIGSASPPPISFLRAAATASSSSNSTPGPSTSSPSQQKLHPSLPDPPKKSSTRPSFADRNAFPRGNPDSAPASSAPSPAKESAGNKPMYSGGYSQKR
ncbi:protein AIR1/2 [Entomortierella parvispora]|uniref:Protein AIR1/2 n=1 Tax=Entomortierella parvispora TaxID=205924 RepID=A0A9P3HH27_9FUNG|nr:protein AIR1/2 [Entomortierella parvispora]